MSILEKINYDIKLAKDALIAFDIVLLDKNTNEDIGMVNKSLLDVNIEHASAVKKYTYCTAEAKALMDFVDIYVRQKKTQMHKDIIENSQHNFTDREREKLFDDNDDYVNIQILYLEIKERYDQFRGMVEALTARGYALNNLTKLTVEHLGYNIL